MVSSVFLDTMLYTKKFCHSTPKYVRKKIALVIWLEHIKKKNLVMNSGIAREKF